MIIDLLMIKTLRAKWKQRIKMNPPDSADQRFYDGFIEGLGYAIADIEWIIENHESNSEKPKPAP